MNESIFNKFEALTFDDVLIVPGYAEVLPDQTDVSTQLTPGLKLRVPILSAAMDTVTEAPLAIAIAREGGLGIMHRNMSPENQAAEVAKVKRSQSGMIVDPITLPITSLLGDAERIMSTYHISGVPIMDANNHLVGIITNRDFRFVDEGDYDQPVTAFMTSDKLVTAPIGITLDEAKRILHQHRIEKLPLVDEDGVLKGLITVKDIQKAQDFPLAAKDRQGRLIVGAAVGVGADLEERLGLMVPLGLDMVVIDTAHGHSAGVLNAIQRIRQRWPELPVVAGNVVTAEGTEMLIKAGASVIKVGVGAGSICTTRIIAGAGMPQLSAIHACAAAAKPYGVPIIADGGIKWGYRESHRSRRARRDVGQYAGGPRRSTRRSRLLRWSPLQGISRDGERGRDARLRARPLRHGARRFGEERCQWKARAGRRRRARALQRAAARLSLPTRRRTACRSRLCRGRQPG